MRGELESRTSLWARWVGSAPSTKHHVFMLMYLYGLDHFELHHAFDDDGIEIQLLALLILGHTALVVLRLR